VCLGDWGTLWPVLGVGKVTVSDHYWMAVYVQAGARSQNKFQTWEVVDAEEYSIVYLLLAPPLRMY
jgi:hypothetical protein